MNKKMLTSVFLCMVLVLALGVACVVWANSGQYDFFGLGQKTAKVLQNDLSAEAQTDEGEIVITQKDIDLLKLKKDFLGLPDDEQQMIDELVRQRVIFCEAEKLDLVMSREEAKQINLDIMAQAEQMLQSDNEAERASAQQMMDYINAYIEGLGVTEEEYWDMAAEEYRQISASTALQEYFKTMQSDKTADNKELFDAAWEEYVDWLVAAAKVEVAK